MYKQTCAYCKNKKFKTYILKIFHHKLKKMSLIHHVIYLQNKPTTAKCGFGFG